MPLLINLLTRKQLLDIGGRRKIHKGFIPSMGGIAIFIGVCFALAVWVPFGELAYYRYVCAAMVIIFITGLRDDYLPLPPSGKLATQLLAATMVVWGGGNFEMGIRVTSFYGFMGIGELPLWASYFVSVFIIIVITNAFNLIDGLDGLAGTISLIAFAALAGWFLSVCDKDNNALVLGLLLVAFVGTILAFLCYNWHPASIFMGDTGSLLIGFVLSVGIIKFLTTTGAHPAESMFHIQAPISVAIAIAIMPLFDTGRIFLLRLSQGRSPFSPDKHHIHHMLKRMNMSHAQVALFMGAFYVMFVGVVVVLASRLPDNVLVPLIAGSCVAFHFLLHYAVNSFFARRQKQIKRMLLAAAAQSAQPA
ncbi:MAG: undecaprenyl/decaprenyl-phosphate alpha-N-acetylglucosaminyl 1-phosphate transferase [Prevotellaceae bacterium]|nr:undecaprenyl/decaprenyl-phosphate alpha-N-acetylglucosaminyl 1-phosphate transferase [Prevotellaceae bacterium]